MGIIIYSQHFVFVSFKKNFSNFAENFMQLRNNVRSFLGVDCQLLLVMINNDL